MVRTMKARIQHLLQTNPEAPSGHSAGRMVSLFPRQLWGWAATKTGEAKDPLGWMAPATGPVTRDKFPPLITL